MGIQVVPTLFPNCRTSLHHVPNGFRPRRVPGYLIHNIMSVMAMTQLLCSRSQHLLGGNQAPVQYWLWPNTKLRPKQRTCSCSLVCDPVLITRHQNYKNGYLTNFVGIAPKYFVGIIATVWPSMSHLSLLEKDKAQPLLRETSLSSSLVTHQ